MVAEINVDPYHHMASSDLTCHLEDSGTGVLWLHYVTWYEKKFGNGNQKASPSTDENIGVVGVPCRA